MDFINIFLHLDQYLGSVLKEYGIWVYLILFLIIFLETGLVVAPFLPGDSLIFLAGAFSAIGSLNIALLFILLTVAAISGDTLNYYIGRHFGRKALQGKIPYVKKDHVDKAYDFYKRHGGKTIVIARFLPLIRTFAPFVAGIARMKYRNFAFYNVSGGVLWVLSFLSLGYYLGNIPFIKDNIEIVIVAIILASILPAAAGFLKARKRT
ncbi:MAG: DedA family protein [Candidatus Aenigmarchaeota archaeon]|nr:DedA family protein [Candidatus Aenigmarchaeota archaeon]